MAFSYITTADIYKTYPQEQFEKLCASDIAENEELTVIEDVKGYLRARYDIDTIFDPEENRNPKIIQVIVDILIYNLLARLNNIDIPIIRKERYDGNDPRQMGGALGWLRRVSKGEIEPDLPLREEGQEDQTGNIVIYGDAEEVKDEKFVP